MAKRKRNTLRRAESVSEEQILELQNPNSNFNNFEDLVGSEDEFEIGRNRITLDNNRAAKRSKQLEEDDMELSDDEVLTYPDGSSDGEGLFTDNETSDSERQYAYRDHEPVDGSNTHQQDGDYIDEVSGWGSKKADYYDADTIENEEAAAAEEAEARRLQDKRLMALKMADYGFDETQWLDANESSQDRSRGEGEVVAEELPRLQITEEMGHVERLRLLNTAYPECEPLGNSLFELLPLYARLAHDAHNGLEGRPVAPIISEEQTVTPKSLDAIKLRALSSYLAAIAMYFAILTSTAEEEKRNSLPLGPEAIHSHEIMESLVRSREVWNRIKSRSSLRLSFDMNEMGDAPITGRELGGVIQAPEADENASILQSSVHAVRPLTTPPKPATSDAGSIVSRAERLRQAEESLASLTNLVPIPSRHLKASGAIASKISNRQQHFGHNSDSDLGDEIALAPHELAEKSRHKKSLRFYTSQIAQRENKRASAGRAAGGDDDLPYRERFRDRQARLMKDAERRGMKSQGQHDETNLVQDDITERDPEETNAQRERRLGAIGQDEVELADAIESQVHAKKAAKAARNAAYIEAHEAGGRVAPQAIKGNGPGARRELTYAIEKNKGLMARRKKEVKNPRVKKRKRFEDKTKKLRSMKSVYTGGEGRSGYAGELTGINKSLVRSTKFST